MRNRLASVWKDQSDLMGKVAIAIMQAKSEIKRPGWHRGSDVEKERLQKQIEYLQEENENLQKLIDSGSLGKKDKNLESSFYGKIVELHYTEEVFVFTSNTRIDRKIVQVTLDELFKFVSLRITGVKKVSEFRDAISAFQKGYYVDEQDALVVRNKYEQVGLIASFTDKDNVETIKLTDLGKRIMNELYD